MLRLGVANGNICSYAVYVLEASTSNRLTYFLPPLVRAELYNPHNPHRTLLKRRLRCVGRYAPDRHEQTFKVWHSATNEMRFSVVVVGSVGPVTP